LRPICYGSKGLNEAEQRYGAPKAEVLAVVYFVEKYRSFLAGRKFILRVDRKFILRVDNQALSWLKTYSMDTGIVGRWITRLDQNTMKIQHRDRNIHQNADGLSKKTEFYKVREARPEEQPKVRTGLPFLSKKQFAELPLLTDVDIHGRTTPRPPESAIQSLEVSVETDQLKEKLGSVEPDKKMGSELDKDELDHHCNAKLRRGQKYTVKDLRKAQEADALLMAVTKLMQDESEKLDGFPRSLRKRAKHFFKGRKNRLYENSQGILCCKGKPSERKLYRNDLIILRNCTNPKSFGGTKMSTVTRESIKLRSERRSDLSGRGYTTR